MKTNRMLIYVLFGTLCMLLASVSSGQENPDNEISRLEWSPDGQLIAATSGPGRLQIWNTESNEQVFSYDGIKDPGALAWSPDSQRLAAAGSDGVVFVWNLALSDLAAMLTASPEEFPYPIIDLAWRPDGSQLMGISQIGEYTIRIWNTETYEIDNRFHRGSLLAAGWHPSLQMPAVGIDGRGVIIIDVITSTPEKLIWQQVGPLVKTTSFAWNSSGDRIAIGDKLATIHLIDSKTPEEIWSLKGHILNNPDQVYDFNGAVFGLAWHPDQRLLASAANDQTVRIWDTDTGATLAVYQHGRANRITDVSWSRYGGRLAFPAKPETVALNAANFRGAVTSFADGQAQIVVPVPSLERLTTVASLCLPDVAPTSTRAVNLLSPASLATLPADALPDFIAELEALPPDVIPPACAADLIAVAEAIIAQGE